MNEIENTEKLDKNTDTKQLMHRNPVAYTLCVCNTIKLLRTRYLVQSKELASHLDMNNSNYSRLERGQVANVDPDIIMKIIEFYQIDIFTFNRYVAAFADKRIPLVKGKLNTHHPFSIYKPDPDPRGIPNNNNELRIFSNIFYPNIDFKIPKISIEGKNLIVDTEMYLKQANTLFIEIPVFSNYEIINSRVVYKDFVGKTYITHKLYLNSIYHGFDIVGLVDDDMISFVPQISFANTSYSQMTNKLDKIIEDEYAESLVPSIKTLFVKKTAADTDIVKQFDAYNYASLQHTSSKIFRSFFDELVSILTEKDISTYISNGSTNATNPYEIYALKFLADKFYNANTYFTHNPLNRNLMDCNDLLESTELDQQFPLFNKIYRQLVKKYNGLY